MRVALMVTLDPVSAGQAPGNVRRLENYYLSTGIGSSIKTDNGFRGQLQNVDVSKRPGVDHVAMTTMPDIHKHIIAQNRRRFGDSLPLTGADSESQYAAFVRTSFA